MAPDTWLCLDRSSGQHTKKKKKKAFSVRLFQEKDISFHGEIKCDHQAGGGRKEGIRKEGQRDQEEEEKGRMLEVMESRGCQ